MTEGLKDEELLERAAAGDEGSFFTLYTRHRNAVFHFSYRLLSSMEAAEDVTQDCFIGLIERPRGFDPGRGQLRTYLYGSARNLAMKHFRRKSREVNDQDLFSGSEPRDSIDPLDKLLENELSSQVKMAISKLTSGQRESLILFEYEGLSLEQIAQVVGSDTGTVKSRLHRARARLRNELSAYFHDSREMAVAEKRV